MNDWLIDPSPYTSSVSPGARDGEIVLENGLVRRRFLTRPNVATIGLENLATGQELLRGIKPEATISINNESYDVGGLLGQVEYGYFQDEWIDGLSSDPAAFRFLSHETGEITERFPWKRARWAQDLPWPHPGKTLVFTFAPPGDAPHLAGILVKVHYEIYDGIPLLCKWISVENHGDSEVCIDTFTSEILAVVDYKPGSAGGMVSPSNPWPHAYFESDHAFKGMDADSANRAVYWIKDPQYTSQVAFNDDDKILMVCKPEIGPAAGIPCKKAAGEGETMLHGLVPWAAEATWEPPAWCFESFRLFELVLDSGSRERRGLARKRMYKAIAPWVTENPLMMHSITFSPRDVGEIAGQMAGVGFEMLIYSFWSGFDRNVLEVGVEHPDWFDDMLDEVKGDIVDAVKENGLEVGGYSLLASRAISDEDDVVAPAAGEAPGLENGPTFGNSPCLGSSWGLRYFDSLHKAFTALGLSVLEHDGSYPGDACASTTHPGHGGLHDSQWVQWKIITSFYKWCRSKGIFLNVPDWYMLSGSNKTGIGYKEVNWSLPRDRQVMLGRQNIYDGTWEKCSSMGWTFCPLTQYHSVSEHPAEVATIEPLSQHLDHYGRMLFQNLGTGVQACYRGTRLYDTAETKRLVKKWVDWYKKYRPILESDVVHVRRPDGRNVDGMLHVDPGGRCDGIKGLAVFFNPTSSGKKETITVDLYYTGLEGEVSVSEKDGAPVTYELGASRTVSLPVDVPPGSGTWYLFK